MGVWEWWGFGRVVGMERVEQGEGCSAVSRRSQNPGARQVSTPDPDPKPKEGFRVQGSES